MQEHMEVVREQERLRRDMGRRGNQWQLSHPDFVTSVTSTLRQREGQARAAGFTQATLLTRQPRPCTQVWASAAGDMDEVVEHERPGAGRVPWRACAQSHTTQAVLDGAVSCSIAVQGSVEQLDTGAAERSSGRPPCTGVEGVASGNLRTWQWGEGSWWWS